MSTTGCSSDWKEPIELLEKGGTYRCDEESFIVLTDPHACLLVEGRMKVFILWGRGDIEETDIEAYNGEDLVG